MHFEKHLFISYAHIDDQPIGSEARGWISRFHKKLEAMVSQRLGMNAVVWRDNKLQGNDIFSDEIVEQFPETALFVSVLTPRYLRSEWCTREVREFCEAAKGTGGVVVDNKSRIFKVIKTPVELDAQDPLPPEVRAALGYEFFTWDEENPLELDPKYGQDMEQAYLRKLNCLSWDIVRLLKRMNGNGVADASAGESGSDKPPVYLSECGHDLHEEREIVEAELKALGYTVLPDQELPRTEAGYVAEVSRLMGQCALSVHLVGDSYGWIPDGPSRKSVLVLQNEAGAELCRTSTLQRIIWLTESARAAKDNDQKQFVEAIDKDAAAQFGADVITGDLEGLKSAIHETLKQIEEARCRPAEEVATGEEDCRQVYLICDERDRESTLSLRKFLKNRGLKVCIPLFEGDAETVHEAEKAYLTDCHAVLLFYGAGDEAWRFGRESDLKKMRAYRGGRPPPISYVYLAEPSTVDKQELITLEEPNLINGLAGFSEEALGAFVTAVTTPTVPA